MIRRAFLVLAALSAPVMAQTPAPPLPKLLTWSDLTKRPKPTPSVKQDLVNGREDRSIPFVMATDYVAKAKAAGDTVTLHTIPTTGHVELIAPETPAWADAKHLILSYLRKTK